MEIARKNSKTLLNNLMNKLYKELNCNFTIQVFEDNVNIIVNIYNLVQCDKYIIKRKLLLDDNKLNKRITQIKNDINKKRGNKNAIKRV